MDDALLKQLIRQLKILNIWISLFGTMMILAIIVVAVLLYQLMSFLGETNRKLDSVKSGVPSATDLQKEACSGDSSLGRFFRNSGACN